MRHALFLVACVAAGCGQKQEPADDTPKSPPEFHYFEISPA